MSIGSPEARCSSLANARGEASGGGVPNRPTMHLHRLACPTLVFALVAATISRAAAPALPSIPARVFDVTQAPYGATGDDASDDTAAIQAALDAAKTAGGGIVLFPAAPGAYTCGPVTLGSGVELRVAAGAVLSPVAYGVYPLAGDRYQDWITAKSATDIAISGGGVIDGRGHAWWEAFEADNKMPHRPYLIKLTGVERLHVHDITLKDSPMFHLVPAACNDVTIERVTITAPKEAHNTDAIDPSGVRHLIRHCTISVGDDNVAIKAGTTFCGDMTIEDCTFGTGHGLSIGGQSTKGLDGLVVRRCTFTGTTSGLRMKADPTQGGLVQNVHYSDITMTDVQYPIVFYSYYKNIGNPGQKKFTPEKAQEWNTTPPTPLASATIPVWRHITIERLKVRGATGYSMIWGLPLADAFISGVRLRDIDYQGTVGIRIYNAHDVQFTGNVHISVSGQPSVTTMCYNALLIEQQPANVVVGARGTAAFEVYATGGANEAGAPTYQWMRDGQLLADGEQADGTIVQGATSRRLELRQIAASAAGSYAAVVSARLDSFDTAKGALVPAAVAVSATSEAAVLSVTPK